MDIIVVDYRENRRKAVEKSLKALEGHRVTPLAQAWGDTEDHGWSDQVQKQVLDKAGRARVVFLHSRNPRAEEVLKSCYVDRFVVCYTAAAPTFDAEIRKAVEGRPNYCLFFKPILYEPPPDEIDWDVGAYLEEIEANRPEKACERLNQSDALLEAKLNFLYECLDACHDSDPTKLPALEKQSKHWKAIREAFGQKSADMDLDLVMSAWSALKDMTDPGNQPGRLREMRIERLKGLRNVFLGE